MFPTVFEGGFGRLAFLHSSAMVPHLKIAGTDTAAEIVAHVSSLLHSRWYSRTLEATLGTARRLARSSRSLDELWSWE